MLRITRMFGSSLAVLVVAAAFAPVAANASPMGRMLHLHPHSAQTKDARISLQVYNKGEVFQDVKVDGQVYTVKPHETITIKAAVGTAVYADSTGVGHIKGDMLFEVIPSMKGATVSFN